ncbi:MAG: hypothetical protein AAGI10_04390 [Pseudomonadota bacterium]
MTPKISLTLFSACGLAIAVGLSPSHAENLGRMLSDSGIEPADIEMLEDAGETLYEADGVKLGETAEWANPETGASGSVTLAQEQGACVELVHDIRVGDREANGFRTWRCLAEDGRWLLATGPQG